MCLFVAPTLACTLRGMVNGDDVGHNANRGDISHRAVYVAIDTVSRTHDLTER